MEWRFEGHDIAGPWGDSQDGRWHVAAGQSLDGLVAALHAQAAQTRAVVESHDLADLGQPGDRWTGEPRRRLSGSCSTWSRSTPGTSATSTSSANSLAARPESNPAR